jgi:hypothetical protein
MQKQKYRHDPENGVFGDCYRTCLANMLGIARDKVPHYVTTMDPKEWEDEVQPKYTEWLSDRGLQELAIPVGGDVSLNHILEWQRTRSAFPATAMLTGTSGTYCNHCVLIRDGEIIHDPSLDDSGIIGPCDDDLYWVTWLIPINN